MNKVLTIVAKIVAKPEYQDDIKNALLGLIEPTLQEVGCINYMLHQDNNDPTVFLFYENWESRELWENHNHSPHIVKHRKNTSGMLADFQLFELSKL